MSEIKKTEKEITGGAYLGSSLCGPASWPAQQASPAHHRRRPPGASRPGVWPARAHGRSATPPARLPASPASATPRRFFSVPPRSPGLIPLSLPCCSLSLSHGRTPPSPPFAIATVSDHPSLPRLAQELRLDSLFLPTAPQLPGSPASPPRRRSPLRAPTTVAVEFAVSSASPSPLRRPLQPR